MNEEYLKNFRENEAPKLLQATTPYIDPEQLDDWKKIIASNSDDGYRISMLRLISDIIILVGQGDGNFQSLEDMEAKITSQYDITLYHMATAVDFASRVSIYGDELLEWWNSKFGVSNAKGVVNPAILMLKKKDDE